MTFPNLQNEKIIAVDTETYDPQIKELGCGARRGGYVLGVGIATRDKRWYFPLAHSEDATRELFENEKIENVDKQSFYNWLRSLRNIPQVGANFIYDLDYLQYENCIPKECHDIQIAGPLIDENKKSYSLDALAQEYLNEKKCNDELKSWCKARGLKGEPRQYIYLMPPALVGKYCKDDCRQTLEIFEKQKPEIKSQKLETVYELERNLIPVLLKMKQLGVRVDTKKLEEIKNISEDKLKKIEKDLKDKYRIVPSENRALLAVDIKAVFDANGWPYEMSDADNGVFDKAALLKNGKEFGALVVEHRHISKMMSTYLGGLEPYIINGRVHPEFNPLRSDEYGTRIGRFSGSRPNLQNIPREGSEDEEIGALIRSLYIPEEDHEWCKPDYSKMEMMSALHFAGGEGSGEMRDVFIKSPELDIYKIIACIYSGSRYEDVSAEQRKLFKTLGLGIMYGMGVDKLGRKLKIINRPAIERLTKRYWAEVFRLKGNWEDRLLKAQDVIDIDERPYFDEYFKTWRLKNKIDKKLSWMKTTAEHYQKIANDKGFVSTILGRRVRFDLTKRGEDGIPSTTFKAFQAVNSGSCADIMKSAMLKAYRDGIMDILPTHITVHDELDVSRPKTKEGEEALMELKNIMETVILLRVPLRVEIERGKNWGTVK